MVEINILEHDENKMMGMDDVRDFHLNFEMEEDEKGNPTSLILTAEKQGEAEWFCVTFFKALSRGNAGFNPTDKGIIFFNKECPFQPAEIAFALDNEKQKKLQTFLKVKKLAVMDMRPKKIGIQIFQYKN
ncbi:MAG: hypothetical protein WA063_02545 [Minisyncoccia bacterium]